MRFAMRIVSWAATIILVAALLALSTLGVAIATGLKPAVIRTGSMRPHYPPGTLILVKPTPANQLRLHQVITFTDPDNPKRGVVTHRIVKIEQIKGVPVFTTQGDANPVPDTWRLRLASDAGLLKYHVPVAGKLSFLVRTKQGYLALVGIPVLILSLLGLMKIWMPEAPQDEEDSDSKSASKRKLNVAEFPDLPTPPRPPGYVAPGAPPGVDQGADAPPSVREAVNA